jgi:hypothetical protein
MALKDFVKGFTSFFTSQKVILLLVFLVIAFVLMYYSGSSKVPEMMYASEGMTNYMADSALAPSDLTSNNNIMIPSVGVPDGANPIQGGSGYSALDTADPADLLPNDVNNAWSQLNPTAQGDIRNPDLLQAGYLIGLDTIGQTLRIPNYQLRADPIIPKQNVGPWNQAPDVDPDYGRVPLDAGCSN